MNILVIKNDGIGDLVLSSGIISYMAQNLADNLDLLTCEQNKEIASRIEYVNKIYYTTRDSIKRYSILNTNRIQIPYRLSNDKCKITKFTNTESNIIKTINQINYDLVIVLRRYIRESSLLLLNKINSKQKLCMWETPTNLSYNSAKRLSNDAIHYTTYNLDKYIKPELEYYESILSKYFKQKIYANPRLQLNHHCLERKNDTIGLIVSGTSVKIGIDDWVQLCQIIENEGYKIILFGGNDQIHLSKDILDKTNNTISLIGKCEFESYEYEFSKLRCIIGNDTGLTHYASLIHNRILVLMGGGTFESFFPWRKNDTSQSIYYHYMECFNCTWVCTQNIKYECLKKLFSKTDTLRETVRNFISNS